MDIYALNINSFILFKYSLYSLKSASFNLLISHAEYHKVVAINTQASLFNGYLYAKYCDIFMIKRSAKQPNNVLSVWH